MRKLKHSKDKMDWKMAVTEGFEPSRSCPQHAFQACALSRSATSPHFIPKGPRDITLIILKAQVYDI